MKIVTRFKMAQLFCVVLVAIVVATLFSTTMAMQRELAKNKAAGDIVQAVTSLRYLSIEYAQHHGARTRSQWQLRSESLSMGLLATPAFNTGEERALLGELQLDLTGVGALFELFVANHRELGQDLQRREVLGELESRLSGQIMGKVQRMIADATRLSELSRQGVLDAQQRANFAVMLCGGMIIALVAGLIYFTMSSVTGPLERLRQGTLIVGAGKLDFVLGLDTSNEIGDLARAFDGMTEKLRRTTVSRDELRHTNIALETQIAERQLAQRKVHEQLERLNLLQHITRSIGERQDLHSIFQVVVRSLEEQLPVDFCCMCLYQPSQHALQVTCVGVRSEALAHAFMMGEQAHIPIDENGLSSCVRGKLVYEADIAEVAFPFPQRLAQGGLRALVMAPLLAENTVFGILIVARHAAHSFTSGECEFLSQLSEHVALAANQTQLYCALQRAYDDLRQTHQSVMQQERLRALGQMASGIAHDINNAISPVALYTESLLETETNLSAQGRHYLEVIERAIDDVATTVARMREFYRQREPQLAPSPINANLVVQQVLDLTRARWSDMPLQRGIVITLHMALADELPMLPGSVGEIREALTNLVFNAVDAMPDGGNLTVRTSCIGVPGQAARQVQIEVSDTGIGMDDNTRRRCLEPFFTTKGERGTGLGLAMVYGMMERHGASIDILTAPGLGTTVRLVFPACAAGVVEEVVETAHAVPPRLRILVVDDDPMVLKCLRDILGIDGHEVVCADGGQAGIDCFQAAHDARDVHAHFAVVVTDLGMPHVDGRKVASAVRQCSPSTPIIMLTGWGQRLTADSDYPEHVSCVLGKPPRLKELRRALNAVMSTG
ncbi:MULTISPECIES: ATP-binding protein [unclassified Janthinobacterium]|uniref:ATP-binding protein n=1 Tax=unclassified Janthinobacterium TaxID=2610881 RepID=UPI002476ACE1|nr:ATP-binding protein [Janthinobacterium sp. CG_23.4]MDH6158266.1 signal transduction histidine kinase/ActR/RegA family two-component response regulator/HAMP domain-containing protein [Janthinobacterium sp. CG_23.4]